MFARMSVVPRLAVLTFLIAMLGGCLGPTPYQVRGLTGGYQEEPAGPNRWRVEFYGNGYTSRDTVMAYWLYRCAELTQQHGFDYFVLTPNPGPSRHGTIHEQPDASDRELARGGRGAPTFVYVPGQSITTWSASAVIEMRKGWPSPDEEPRSFIVKELMATLGPAVRGAMASGGNVTLPPELATAEAPRKADAGPVKLEDLEALLPR